MIGKILKFTVGFIAGGIAGTVITSLVTPKAGETIREDLKIGFDEIRLDFELGKQKKQEELEAEIRRRCGE